MLGEDPGGGWQFLLLAEAEQIVQHLAAQIFRVIPHENRLLAALPGEYTIEQRLDRLRVAMPFRKRLVNDGPLQHEIQALLRDQRAAAQLQRMPSKKLKRTIEKAFEPAGAETARRHGQASAWIRRPASGRLGPRGQHSASGRLVEELGRHIPRAASIRFGVTHRQRCGGARPGQLEQEPLFTFQFRGGPHADTGLREALPDRVRKQRLLRVPLGKLLLRQSADEHHGKLPLPRLEHAEHVGDVAPRVGHSQGREPQHRFGRRPEFLEPDVARRIEAHRGFFERGFECGQRSRVTA